MRNLKKLNAGDSASWHDDPWVSYGQRYCSTDWTLTYALRGPSELSLLAVADADGWRTHIGTDQSAGLTAGQHAWAAYLTKPGERVTAATGTLIVVADIAAISGWIDTRSVAVRALADCEAALATFKSSGGKVKSYTIGNRATEFHSLVEVMQLRSFWQRRVNTEQKKNRRLLVRF